MFYDDTYSAYYAHDFFRVLGKDTALPADGFPVGALECVGGDDSIADFVGNYDTNVIFLKEVGDGFFDVLVGLHEVSDVKVEVG